MKGTPYDMKFSLIFSWILTGKSDKMWFFELFREFWWKILSQFWAILARKWWKNSWFSLKNGLKWAKMSYFLSIFIKNGLKLGKFQVKIGYFELFSFNFNKGVVQDLIWFSLIFSEFSGKYCFKFNLILLGYGIQFKFNFRSILL